MGIGVGLVADEVGLLILKLAYWNAVSVSILLIAGLGLVTATFVAALRDGLEEFRYLDRYQLLYILSLVLGFTGFLYFDRPVRVIVQFGALTAWLSSVVLVAKYGRKHFWLIRNMPLSYEPPHR
jgi:hypothetical protein